MKTLLALLVPLLLVSHAAAQPRCSAGRFVVDGDPIDLGAPADRITAIEVDSGDPAVVRIDGPCASGAGKRILRRRATLVRALLEGCGDAPRTRLRMRLPNGCDGAFVRVRRAGVTITQRLLRLDPGTPGGVPSAAILPRLTGFSPGHGAPGDVITVFGTDLDRDRNGDRWQGTPPWELVFSESNLLPRLSTGADVTFVSPTELRVTVTALAVTGPLSLVQAGPPFAATAAAFVVDPAPPTNILRLTNHTQYRITSLRADGTERVTDAAAVVEIGASVDLPAPTGSVQVEMGFGVVFGDAPVLTRSAGFGLVTPGTTNFTLQPFTIGQLLTDFEANLARLHSWVSSPVQGTDGRDHVETLAVSGDGRWAIFVDAGFQPSRSGTLSLVDWPDNSLAVQFRLADDLPVITIRAPFTSFRTSGLVFTAR